MKKNTEITYGKIKYKIVDTKGNIIDTFRSKAQARKSLTPLIKDYFGEELKIEEI